MKILIPGAGNGYEFDYLLEKGFTESYVIDIVQNLLMLFWNEIKLKKKTPNPPRFFEHSGQYDLIIEQTFSVH